MKTGLLNTLKSVCEPLSAIRTVLIVLLFGIPVHIQAHPGGTDLDGCHKCRTNCTKWEVAWDQKHCHNGAITKTSTPKDEPITETYLGLTVAPESSAAYDRKDYKHWIDADGDKADTRQEVLFEESAARPMTEIRRGKVVVTEGFWVCPYTGMVYADPAALDVDHMVPLKEAHESGGHAWSPEQKEGYANDLFTYPQHLIAVASGSNRSKGAKDPAEWLPPNRAYWCDYIEDWVAIKKTYNLSIDQAERDAIKKTKSICSKYQSGDALGGRH